MKLAFDRGNPEGYYNRAVFGMRRHLSWIEGLTTNQYVGGSNPSRRTICILESEPFSVLIFFISQSAPAKQDRSRVFSPVSSFEITLNTFASALRRPWWRRLRWEGLILGRAARFARGREPRGIGVRRSVVDAAEGFVEVAGIGVSLHSGCLRRKDCRAAHVRSVECSTPRLRRGAFVDPQTWPYSRPVRVAPGLPGHKGRVFR